MKNFPAAGSPPQNARERILHTAHGLFYREGVRATGVDRLIADSKVTKTTFYRHFPSKNDLILAFLDHRHQLWLAWFDQALAEHGRTVDAICPALKKWFESEDFRGCAFINSITELEKQLPKVVETTQRHKQQVASAIEVLLPPGRQRKKIAATIAMAVDGAIVKTQIEQSPVAALASLKQIIAALTSE